MSILVFIVIVVVLSSIIAPIATGYGRRLAKGAPQDADMQRLTQELERAEQRLSEAERRLSLAEERLDFQEKLLTDRPAPEKRLPSA